jgi:hypothetical protein
MSPQPHPQPRTLDDLLANVEHHVNYAMRQFGHITPALFFIGSDGQDMFAPESFADESEKDDFATKARLTCIAHAATACIIVLKAWARFGKLDEKLDLTEPPSEAFDRKEVVVLMGESRSVQKQKLLPIIRSGNGKFFGFGDPHETHTAMQGRFAAILPQKEPDAKVREVAKAMLKVKGVERATSGGASRFPRSRR